MPAELELHLDQLAALCAEHAVVRLSLFGSATTGDFNVASGNLEFLVRFEEMPPAAYADAYFGLLEALEKLFSQRVNLLTERSVSNPYLQEEIERTQELLYAA